MTVTPYPTYDTGSLLALSNTGNVTVSSSDQQNTFSRGVIVVGNFTVLAGNITINIQGKDAASGQYYDLLTGSVIAGNSTNVLTVYPGVTVVSGAAASSPLPAFWRAQAIVSSNGNVSGTIGASVIS